MPTLKPQTPEDWSAFRADITEAFSPGAPVQEKDLFSGRTAQIAALMDAQPAILMIEHLFAVRPPL